MRDIDFKATTVNLLSATALELAQAYRARTLSPVEATKAILEAIPDFDSLNAFCHLSPEQALSAASASERRYNAGAPLSGLDGVPIGIKDLLVTKGMPTRRGSLTTSADDPCDADAPAVARLREAGAVILGKTTTPEFGWKGITDSVLTGTTRNPWKPTHTPGGSSGGSAVQVACGLGPISIGTDGAGSIRIPSSFSGVFGHKASYGRVPAWPASQVGTLANIGPMTRTVADAALTLSIISKWDARDWYALPQQEMNWADLPGTGLKGLRVAYSPDLGFGGVDPDVAALVKAAVEKMAELGAHVTEITPPIGDMNDTIDVLWQSGCAYGQRHMTEAQLNVLEPGLREAADRGRAYTLPQYLKAVEERSAFGARMREFHTNWDLLVLPTMPGTAFEVNQLGPKQADGSISSAWRIWNPFCYLFNLTMQPAASLPCGFTAKGLPVGLQVVGRMHDDLTVLRACAALEPHVSPLKLAPRPN